LPIDHINRTFVKGVFSIEKLLCPSIFNLSFDNLKDEILRLDKAGTDIFHIDIMDGSFVPNFGLSLQDMDVVRHNTDKLIDVHLMVNEAGRYVRTFAERGADIIYIHPEAETHPVGSLVNIRKAGKAPGIAINPGTSIAMVEELFPFIDYMMVMAVHPGIAGQPYIDAVEPKIRKLAKLKEEWGFKLMVDGGVNWEVMKRLSGFGVEGYVLGNLILFKQEEADYKVLMDRMKAL
jgi:ribulose-phosphate 3-epimerase